MVLLRLVVCFLCQRVTVSDFGVEFHRCQVDCGQDNYGNDKGEYEGSDCPDDWGDEHDNRDSNDPCEDIDTDHNKK